MCVTLFYEPIFGNHYGPGVTVSSASQGGMHPIFRIAGVQVEDPQPVSLRQPGVAGSSPSTLTSSLAILVPSSSSSNGLTTTPLTTRSFCPGGSVVWTSPKIVATRNQQVWDNSPYLRSNRYGITVPTLNQVNNKSRVTCDSR